VIVRQAYVRCRECGQRHTTEEIELLDVAEDIEGRDVATFNCPVTQNSTTSLVYIG
jgi:transcription elongation factor Elf1